jgi:hypothetical protein
MKDEHCVMAGHDYHFVSDNYGVKTTPSGEYMITVGEAQCPPESLLDKKGRPARKVKKLEDLQGLKVVTDAKLDNLKEPEEIISVVSSTPQPPHPIPPTNLLRCDHSESPLPSCPPEGRLHISLWQVLYTGPMYQIYNAILRQHPKEVYEFFKAGGNFFATTIHILVSAVVKIARVMSISPSLDEPAATIFEPL